MPKYSRGHERDEGVKMWRGFWHSTFGILLCWVPVVGLLMSISGFARQAVRMTDQYKKRWALFFAYAALSLVISVGAIMFGLYKYGQDPNVFNTWGTNIWRAITGQQALPGQTPVTDFTGMPDPGLGSFGMEGEQPIDGEGDSPLDGEIDPNATPVPDEPGEGNVIEPEASDAEIASKAASVGDDAATLGEDEETEETEEEDDAAFDEDESFEELPELEFAYEVLDQEEFEQDDELCTSYKVCTDKPDMTDQDLLDLFKDVTFGDEYYLHNVYIYTSDENYMDEPYDYAAIEQKAKDADPVITRK